MTAADISRQLRRPVRGVPAWVTGLSPLLVDRGRLACAAAARTALSPPEFHVVTVHLEIGGHAAYSQGAYADATVARRRIGDIPVAADRVDVFVVEVTGEEVICRAAIDAAEIHRQVR